MFTNKRDESPIYYRILRGKTGAPKVIEMQWFDEFDYDQSKFLNDTKYETEADAKREASRLLAQPCDVPFAGRRVTDWCEACGHGLLAHRSDRVCSVCEAVAEGRRLRPSQMGEGR